PVIGGCPNSPDSRLDLRAWARLASEVPADGHLRDVIYVLTPAPQAPRRNQVVEANQPIGGVIAKVHTDGSVIEFTPGATGLRDRDHFEVAVTSREHEVGPFGERPGVQ